MFTYLKFSIGQDLNINQTDVFLCSSAQSAKKRLEDHKQYKAKSIIYREFVYQDLASTFREPEVGKGCRSPRVWPNSYTPVTAFQAYKALHAPIPVVRTVAMRALLAGHSGLLSF